MRLFYHLLFQVKTSNREDVVQSLISICQGIMRIAAGNRSSVMTIVKHFVRKHTLKQEQKSQVVQLSSTEDPLQGTAMV